MQGRDETLLNSAASPSAAAYVVFIESKYESRRDVSVGKTRS